MYEVSHGDVASDVQLRFVLLSTVALRAAQPRLCKDWPLPWSAVRDLPLSSGSAGTRPCICAWLNQQLRLPALWRTSGQGTGQGLDGRAGPTRLATMVAVALTDAIRSSEQDRKGRK